MTIDGLIAGVLRNLPMPSEGFKTNEERKRWLAVFHSAFELLYPDEENKK